MKSSQSQSLLLVGNDADVLARALTEAGFPVIRATDSVAALSFLGETPFDAVVVHANAADAAVRDTVRTLRRAAPDTALLVAVGAPAGAEAIGFFRDGAYDVVDSAEGTAELTGRLRVALDHAAALRARAALRAAGRAEPEFEAIVGGSRRMRAVFDLIRKVASTRSNVLITGRSGTGKELVARAIHAHSERRDRVFLPINCGAISASLIESELFGHKRGAFTDAVQDKQGVFQLADGGTLFLDEVAEIPMPLQVKLLRAIDEREVFPVGGSTSVRVDVRLLSATNQDLPAKVARREFREDLYYRLDVVEIPLPSLAERAEDIPLLVEHFVRKYAGEIGRPVLGVDGETMRALLRHDWRGGVRELENVIERAVIFCDGDTITTAELPPKFAGPILEATLPEDLRAAMAFYERRHVLEVLARNDYAKEEAARALGIGLSSLYRKIEEYGITPEELGKR